ncbi:MAG: flagellar biosynthetic protein FliQ [Oligoflexia bacterium]|nr:flagellar biosynthetic protein FliQ [Oligoflexia bacterium]
MSIDDFLLIGIFGVETAVFIAAPVLCLSLAAGLVVSIFQASTQINDSSLAFIPKIAAMVVGLVFFGNFMINRLAGFTTWIYTHIATLTPN